MFPVKWPTKINENRNFILEEFKHNYSWVFEPKNEEEKAFVEIKTQTKTRTIIFAKLRFNFKSEQEHGRAVLENFCKETTIAP